MLNLDPKFDIIAMRDKVVIENEGIGAKVGGLGGVLESTVSQAINVDGNFTNDVIGTVGGRVADIIATAIDAAGHFADNAISTADGEILGEFTFGNSGAIQIGTYESGVTGDIRISPTGILGRDKTGATTFSINGTTGVAVLNGLVVGTNVDIGTAVDSIGVTTIIDNTVTTGYVNALSITALGTVTAGAFVLDSSGYIRGGQTAYNTGTGFFLGYDTSAYKFSIGVSTGDRMTFDGTIINLQADVKVRSLEYLRETIQTSFESIDGWDTSGTVTPQWGEIQIQTAASLNTVARLYPKTFSGKVNFRTKNPMFQTRVRFTNTTEQLVYIITGSEAPGGTGDDEEFVGFKVVNGTLYSVVKAVAEGASAEYATEITGITIVNTYHDYKVVVDSGTSVKFYIDNVLKDTRTTNLPVLADPVGSNLIMFYIKTTDTAYKRIHSKYVVYSQDF
jgi:hypothetical protein